MKKQIPSPRRKSSFIAKAQAGFSLIELLVVIAVIGIIAAIAIPNIGNLTSGADKAKDQRNAQNITSVFSAARAAGHNVTLTRETAVAAVTGTTPLQVGGTDGPLFHVPIPEEDKNAAMVYIDATGTGTALQLVYDKDGGHPAGTTTTP